jgi:hypothetical protein
MTPKVGVRVLGADRVASTLGRLAEQLADLDTEARAGAELVTAAAAARAPRRSGAMAASLRTDVADSAASISAAVPYAIPLDKGVGPRPGRRGPHNIRATRWLTGAAQDQTDRVVRVFDTSVTRWCAAVRGA